MQRLIHVEIAGDKIAVDAPLIRLKKPREALGAWLAQGLPNARFDVQLDAADVEAIREALREIDEQELDQVSRFLHFILLRLEDFETPPTEQDVALMLAAPGDFDALDEIIGRPEDVKKKGSKAGRGPARRAKALAGREYRQVGG